MNRCPRNGFLVGADWELSSDLTELDVQCLPLIGCNRIWCSHCNVAVRNALGVAFRTRGSIALYDGLARYDPDWFVEYIEHLVKAAPAQADNIVSSFSMLPDEFDTNELKERVAQARNS